MRISDLFFTWPTFNYKFNTKIELIPKTKIKTTKLYQQKIFI